MRLSKRKPKKSADNASPPAKRAGNIISVLPEPHWGIPSLLSPRVRWWTGLIAFAALLWVIYLVRQVLPPFILAFAIAAVLDGQLKRLERRGYSRVAATALVFLAFILLVIALLLYLVPLIVSQMQGLIRDLPSFVENALRWFQEQLQPFLKRHQHTLSRLHLPQDPQVLLERYSEQVQQHFTKWLSNLLGYLTGLLGKLFWVILVPIITFFVMIDLPRMQQRFAQMLPERSRTNILALLRALGVVWTGYLKGLATVAVLYGAVMGVVFTVLGLRYSVVMGVLAGLLYIVPYVGPLTTSLVAGLVAFFAAGGKALWIFEVPAHSWQYTVLVVGSVLGFNVVFDQVLTPRIVGGSVGLRPVASIFALVVGAQLFGIWGMLLAMPVAASLWIVLLALFPSLRPHPEQTGGQPQKEHTNASVDTTLETVEPG